MKFWDKVMHELATSNKCFSDIYSIMMHNFSKNVFCKTSNHNRIEQVSYQELDLLVRKVAGGLSIVNDLKATPDFIGIKLDNSVNWVAAFYGSLMAGFRPLLINTRSSTETQQKIIQQTNLAFIVGDGTNGTINIHELLQSTPIETCKINWANEVALTTSGTTGVPKICIYNGQGIAMQINSAREAIASNHLVKNNRQVDVTILAFLPFYHIFGFIGNLMWFGFFGRTFVFLENLDPKTIQNTIKQTKVTHLLSIPLVWNGIANTVLKNAIKENKTKSFEIAINFSIRLQSIFPRFGRFIVRKIIFKSVRERIFGDSLVFSVSGGSYINKQTLKIINGLGYPLFNGFGMTEIGIYSVDLNRRVTRRIQGDVGLPFKSFESQLDESGQLLVRGPAMIYATYENYQFIKTDQATWFPTNDIFMKHSTGSLGHKYRHDEMLIGENGENISPYQIEEKFILPHAKHAVVIGYVDKGSKYTKTLVIEMLDGFSELHKVQTIKKIYETMTNLPIQEVINEVIIMKEKIPVLLESKIQRNLLRKQLIDQTIAGEYLNKNECLQQISKTHVAKKTSVEVIEVFAQVLNLSPASVNFNSHFAIDLNGSSMEYFALIAALSEKYNLEFNIDQENLFTTPESFSNYIVAEISE